MRAVRLPFTRTASSGVATSDDAVPARGVGGGPRRRATGRHRVPWVARRARPWQVALAGLLLSGVVALGLTLLLDASSWAAPGGSLVAAAEQPGAVAVSVLLVWVVVALLVAVVGRLWLGLGLALAVALVLGAVNRTKIQLRSDPLVPSDVVYLRQPGFLLDMTGPGTVAWAVLGIVAVVALTALLGRGVARWLPPLTRGASRRGRWLVRGVRVAVVLVCLGLLHLTAGFNQPHNPWREAVEATGLTWASWDQSVNYQRNGFVPGMLFNAPVEPMSRPPGYSRAAVADVVSRYQRLADEHNEGRRGSLGDTNVVVVLSESFSQPDWLDGVGFPLDLTPRTTATMQRTLSGRMLAPGLGGGTANTEFEVLTGQSMSQLAPALVSPFEQMIAGQSSFPSIVGWLRDHGHETVAVHPFSPRMYSRPEVYRALGFDRFLSKDDLSFRSRGGGRFINDRAVFRQALQEIDASQRPVLAHLVTMQNHMPYEDQYDGTEPVPNDLPGENNLLAGLYGEGLQRTDTALAEFLRRLQTSPEPTVVVFYGDHLPPQVYPEDFLAEQTQLAQHQTPFLIWSNQEPLRDTAPPTTSATQFLPLALDALDVPEPPWFALLDAVRAEVPAMDAGMMVGPTGRLLDRDDLDPQARAVLADYRMVQYDLSIGRRWSLGAMFREDSTWTGRQRVVPGEVLRPGRPPLRAGGDGVVRRDRDGGDEQRRPRAEGRDLAPQPAEQTQRTGRVALTGEQRSGLTP